MNRRWIAVLALAASLATACAGGGSSGPELETATSIPGPVGELATTSGSVFGFEDIVGEPTVLWFWGPG